VIVYGAGGFAREVAWLLLMISKDDGSRRPVAFVDDASGRDDRQLNGLPILDLDQAVRRFPGAAFVAAIGSPTARRAVTEKAITAGFVPARCIAPDVLVSDWVDVGEGVVICSGSILTTNIRLGTGVQINLDCTVGHDVVMGDYTTLAPGVHVSGWVHFGANVYVGTGAVLINGTEDAPLIVGDGAVVGAGACVTHSVEPSSTVVGVPAKPR